jgi:hypothetical protein
VPNTLDARKEISLLINDWREADLSFAKTSPINNLSLQCRWVAKATAGQVKVNLLSDPNLAPRPNQALPLVRIDQHLSRQQNLDAPRKKFVISHPPPIKSSRKHPRIVYH